MIRYLLDTNIAIYVIKRKPIELLDVFNRYTNQLAISSVTLAELMHGVEKSQYYAKNLANVEAFTARLHVLDYGKKAAAHYGNMRASLEKQGKPIGVNDLHIAAHARSEGLVLVTNNEKEFTRIDGLRVENWVGKP